MSIALTTWLSMLPTTIAVLVAITGAGVISGFCIIIVHRLIPHSLRSLHNDVAGFLLAIVGLIYAVLLAFIAVAVWESYTAADALVQTEASLVDDLYRGTVSLPPAVAHEAREDLYAYTEIVVRSEWPELAGRMPMHVTGWHVLDAFHVRLSQFHPDSGSELAAQTSMLRQLNQLYDVRRGRFHAAASSLPAILWWNLLAGALILVLFSCLFGAPRFYMHGVMVMLLGASVGLVLMLIVLLDNPFGGRSHVSSEPFQSLSRTVETMDYPHAPSNLKP